MAHSVDKEIVGRALELLREAYQHQMSGDLESAIDLYKLSIELFPTAEAHTFLGWTYSFQERYDEAIAECRKAIQIDPDFGNPYNDIGSYLIELNRYDEAIPWLEKAIHAPRYESYHFPWMNLGRLYMAKELYNKARECFQRALEHAPEYAPALEGLKAVRRLLQ